MKIVNLAITLGLPAATLALCVAQAARAEELAVIVPAILDPAAAITEAVKRECGVESRIAEEVFLRVSERIPGAKKISDPPPATQNGPLLKITIMGVLGVGGGSWSGPKAIAIRADVVEHAKLIQTTTLRRQSSGGAFGGLSGTCPIMDRIAAALGRDVAGWVPFALRQRPAAAAPAPSQ